MNVEFDRSFLKSLEKTRDSKVFPKVLRFIQQAEKARNLHHLKQVKKLSGYKSYYRIRLGDYRLGFEEINSNTIRIIILVHRKDFYRKFP